MATKKIEKATLYTATAKLKIAVGVEVEANSLEEAAVKAKTLKVHEILDLEGVEVMDYETPDISAVWRTN
jgi:hypothetical protein